jgi:hypothetical protein
LRALLRATRFTFWRMRLRADAVFAMGIPVHINQRF